VLETNEYLLTIMVVNEHEFVLLNDICPVPTEPAVACQYVDNVVGEVPGAP
jgi:hypothetical protein